MTKGKGDDIYKVGGWGCVIRASCRVQDGAHSISSVAVRCVGSLAVPLTVMAVVVAVDVVVGVLAGVVLCGGKHGAQNLDVFLSTPPPYNTRQLRRSSFWRCPQHTPDDCIRLLAGSKRSGKLHFFNPRRHSK